MIKLSPGSSGRGFFYRRTAISAPKQRPLSFGAEGPLCANDSASMVNEELMGAGCMARPVSRCRSTGQRRHKKAPGAGAVITQGPFGPG